MTPDTLLFQTTHALPFESTAPIERYGWYMLFRVGTCEGQYRATWDAYEILSIVNDNPGNGHLDDVFEWFEHSCKRDGKVLRVSEIWNERFYLHLIKKRGFKPDGSLDLIKTFGDGKAC